PVQEPAQIVEMLLDTLLLQVLVPEDEDISLAERCKRVNRVCSELGRRNVCLVSIHVIAAGPATSC
ncbi:MAG: hypothetical protein J6V81_06855, partial [Bacteroidales bacterium]|nr:hypothetical protein [Bacteroidales bacterium]